MNRCDSCEGKDVISIQEDHLKKFGWYAHYIDGDDSCPFGVNYHTHGFEESYGHPDLQICFPISAETCHNILSNLQKAIKEGHVINENDRVGRIIANFDVTFIQREESNRKILRVILPDEKGTLDKDKINPIYIDQWK